MGDSGLLFIVFDRLAGWDLLDLIFNDNGGNIFCQFHLVFACFISMLLSSSLKLKM